MDTVRTTHNLEMTPKKRARSKNHADLSYRRIVCILATAVLLVVLFAPKPALAIKAKAPDVVAPDEILPDESDPTERRGNQRVRISDGVPVTIWHENYGVGVPGGGASPQAMAQRYLRDNANALRLPSSHLQDLTHKFTRSANAGHTVRFQQEVGGIPVYKSEIGVTIGPGDVVKYVSGTHRTGNLSPAGGREPVVDRDQAREAALQYLSVVDGGIEHESIDLVIYPRPRGAATRLAWEIHVIPSIAPMGDWEVLIDAMTGELFKVVDIAHYFDGSGKVFQPDPLSSANADYGDPGFTDGGDADTTELTAQLYDVTLKDITLDGSTYKLTGPWAAIVDTESPNDGLFSQSSPNFDFTREQSGFEAVNCYYHIDTMMRHLNDHLGLSITPYQYSGGVRFDPHGLSGSDNSHYTRSSGVIAFGEGGVDDAEDADVVIHELGHGLHDWVTNGGLSQVEGLSEGSGDYIAASYSRSFNQWGPSDPQYYWVFDWDGHNPFWGGRSTNYGATYPGGLTGSIHTDGQIWATCNMKIWDLIGRDKTDRAFWSGLGMTSGSTNQEDAAQAVLQAAVNLGYSGADVSTMEITYQGCGYSVTAPCSATCSNDISECGEVCDGADLGGETCSSLGCTGGGTLSCSSNCGSFDISSCLGCAQCNNDGNCDQGEDCNGCPGDCVGGTTSGSVCGNGICEAGNGENCVNCGQDCNGRQGGKPSNRFCCGDGGGTNPVSCSDSRCGSSCTNTQVSPGSFCCGDQTCDSGESCSNCALDCSTGPEICNDDIDNDCDGFTDCDDSDCTNVPSCTVTCGGSGSSCSDNGDCCSNKCKGGSCKGKRL